MKLSLSKPYLDSNKLAHLFIGMYGFYRETTFRLEGQDWQATETWEDITFVASNQTEKHTRDIEAAIRNALSILRVDAVATIKLTLRAEDGDPPPVRYLHGHRYRFVGILWRGYIENGLALGFPFDKGSALLCQYKQEPSCIDDVRAFYAKKERVERVDAFCKALELKPLSSPPEGEQTLIWQRSRNWRMYRIEGRFLLETQGPDGASPSFSEILGSRAIKIGIHAYYATDNAEHAIRRLLAEVRSAGKNSAQRNVASQLS